MNNEQYVLLKRKLRKEFEDLIYDDEQFKKQFANNEHGIYKELDFIEWLKCIIESNTEKELMELI